MPMADLLVVDNDARIAELVAWFLEKGGHSARVVTSYAQAREALRERRFALMLADLELGVEDGRVELPLLESEGLLPPTLVVSGYLDAEITEALFKVPGILGTVPKPFEPKELLERMAEDKYRSAISASKSAGSGAAGVEERPLWILKPTLGARGEGIELLWEPEQVPERGENTVQVRTKRPGLSS